MISATLAILALSPISFKGGDPGIFAQELAATTGKPIMISVGRSEKMPAINVDPIQRNTFDSLINSKSPLTVRPGLNFVFSDEYSTESLFQSLSNSPDPVPVPHNRLPLSYLSNGLVTIAPKDGRPYPLAIIIDAKWSKKATAFWLYRPLYVYIQVTKMPERNFFQLLSKTIGGDLVVGNSSYNIKANWSNLVPSLNKTFGRMLKTDKTTDKTEELHRQLFVSMFKAMDQTTIASLFSGPANNANYNIAPNSQFGSIALDYIKQLAAYQQSQPRGSSKSAVGIINRIDPRAPVQLHVDVTGQSYLAIPVIFPATRRIRFVRSKYINL